MLSIIGWIITLIGVICIIVSFMTFKRKDEFELSGNVTDSMIFRAGAFLALLGIVINIILGFILK